MGVTVQAVGELRMAVLALERLSRDSSAWGHRALFLTDSDTPPALTHGFAFRYDLALPLHLYLSGSGAVVFFFYAVYRETVCEPLISNIDASPLVAVCHGLT